VGAADAALTWDLLNYFLDTVSEPPPAMQGDPLAIGLVGLLLLPHIFLEREQLCEAIMVARGAVVLFGHLTDEARLITQLTAIALAGGR